MPVTARITAELRFFAVIPNAHIIQTKDIEEKIVQIKAEIVGIAGSYVENRQREYGQFLPIDWA